MAFRFSIRAALMALSIGAAFSIVLAHAVRGAPWAMGFVLGLLSLLALAAPCAVWFWVVRLVGRLSGQSPPGVRRGVEYPPKHEA